MHRLKYLIVIVVTHRHARVSHIFHPAARLNAFIEAHPVLVVRILPRAHDILVTLVVGFLIQHPAATLYLDGVAAAEVGVQVHTVTAAVITATLEILLLKKCELRLCERRETRLAVENHLKKLIRYIKYSIYSYLC